MKLFKILFSLIFFIFPQYSFAQQTNTQLLALIQSLLPTNGNNEISAADLRTVLANMVNSTNVTNTACLTASLTNYQWFADNAVPANVLIQLYDGTQCVTVGTLNTVSHTFSVASSTNNLTVGSTVITGGTNGNCLYDNAGVLGEQNCGGGGSVSSVFGRTGTVTAQSGDYTASQVGALAIASNLSDLASAATARTNLGLGTFATQNFATPPAIGGTTPAIGTFTTLTVTGITGATQCVQITAGVLSGTGSACGSGGGAVNSVTNSDGTLTISPTTGSVAASIALGHANTWTGVQTFIAPALGTPTALVLTNASGLPATALPAGVRSNTLNSQTSAYSIATTDCGKTVQAGTGTTGLFTVTLPAVSGFASNCVVTIVNGDTARGKALSGFPTGVASILYPRQSIAVAIVNGAWATLRLPGRYRPSATLTFFVDGTLGSDSNDGLASGSGGAFLTFGAATTALFNNIDKNGQSIVLQLASGQSWSNLSYVGTTVGNGAVILDGGGGTISGTGGVNAFVVENGVGGNVANSTFLIQNVTFTCTGGGNALDVVSGFATLNGGITFGTCTGGAHIEADGPARIFVLGNYTISGGAGYHWLAAANGLIDFNVNVTVTLSGTPAFSQQFANAQMNATIFSIVTFSGSATGTRWNATLNGVVNSGTGTPNSYFPGNANGSATTGGQGN